MTSEGRPAAAVADVPASLPSLPRYGESTLADLACSVLASLGVGSAPDPLRLPPADRACLLVVDGLGWELLRDHQAAAPFLSELAVTGRALTSGFPATTATSSTDSRKDGRLCFRRSARSLPSMYLETT